MSRPLWKYNPAFSRRAFLGSLGASAALAPFVPILNVSGQESLTPKRLVLWFTPHGTIYDNWKPTGTATDFTLSPILAPLERHKSKIVVLDGIKINADGVGAPHTKGPPHLWTGSRLIEDMTFERADGSGGRYYGWNSGPSIDQVIAEQIDPTTPYRTLEFGVRSGNSHPGSRMIYTGAEQPVAPEADPFSGMQRLLGDLTQGKASLEQLLAERRSSLDIVKAELASLQARVSTEDRLKIEAHTNAIGDIERRLNASITSCEAPDLGDELDPNGAGNTPNTWQRQMDLMATALACDLTRIASMQYRRGENDSGYLYDWLGVTQEEHHLLTHSGDEDAGAVADLTKIYTWYTDQFAYFLDKLDSIPEGNGTVLDNTLVVWGSELGKGNTHAFEKVPFVLAGGLAGSVNTGRYLQYDGTEHNRLLVTMANLMGVTDMQSFGDTDVGQGPLVGLV